MHVALGQGDGTFTTGVTFLPPSEALDLLIGDFTGDGLTDLAATGPSVVVFPGNGDGTFGVVPGSFVSSPMSSGGTRNAAAVDLNGDRILDVAAVDFDGLKVVLGLGGGQFAPPILSDQIVGSALALGDLDASGAPDALGSSPALGLSILENELVK